MSLKDYLKETLDLGRDDVFKVDVKEGFSFFNTDPEHTDKVIVLNNVQLEGRRINVEISKNDGGGRRDHNGRSSGGGFGGGRSSAPRREGSFAPRREGSGGDLEATETQPKRRWFLEEAQLQEKVVLWKKFSPRGEGSLRQSSRRSESFGDSPRPRRPRRD
jgi:ATP-dependent RNA helicase DeaD